MRLADRCNTVTDDIQVKKPHKKVGILGGTFNPPHLAHLDVARKVHSEFMLDLILLLPNGNPPHKQDMFIASKFHREQMLEIFTKKYPFLHVCPIELRRKGYIYTVDSLELLKKELGPEVDLYYIIGTDTLFELESWKDFLKVFSLTDFICVMRPGDSPANVQRKLEYFKSTYGKIIRISRYKGLDISSTLIRERIAQKQSIHGLVPEEVEEYLVKNDVYGSK